MPNFFKLHNYLVSSTCQAIKEQGGQKSGAKSEKVGQKARLGCLCRPVLPSYSSFTSFGLDTNLLICRAANLVDICREGERWMCTLLSSARI